MDGEQSPILGLGPQFYMKNELIYLSHPMTRAQDADKHALAEAKAALKKAGMFVHCPADSEAEGQPLCRCQDADFQFMKPATGHFVVWPVPYGKLSVGSVAELEWARRIYHIPSVIWVPCDPDFPMEKFIDLNGIVPPWCQANADVRLSLSKAIELLRNQIR